MVGQRRSRAGSRTHLTMKARHRLASRALHRPTRGRPLPGSARYRQKPLGASDWPRRHPTGATASCIARRTRTPLHGPGGPFHDHTRSHAVEELHFIRPDVAIAALKTFDIRRGGETTTVEETRGLIVLSREDGHWKVTAIRTLGFRQRPPGTREQQDAAAGCHAWLAIQCANRVHVSVPESTSRNGTEMTSIVPPQTYAGCTRPRDTLS
jgi:hypothetical protein